VRVAASSEESLRRGLVDLWPLITITPERKRLIHFTDPYLQHDHCVLVRESSPYQKQQDLANATILYTELPLNQRLLHSALPNAKLISSSSPDRAIEDVCGGRAEAFFTNEFNSISALSKGRTCEGRPLRQIWFPNLRTQLAVGSTFRASGVADRIRDGIGTIANEGKLSAITVRWGYFSPWNQETMNALIQANRRERLWIAALIFSAVFFGMAILAIDRMRRQKARIETLQAAATLLESEARFKNMADTAPVMIWVTGADNMATFFNKQWLVFTGRTSEQELGTGWKQGIHPDDGERCVATFDACFAARRNYQHEHRWRRADGEYRWLLCTGIPRFTEGNFAGYVGCSIDITDHKRQQERLVATQKLESLGVLAGGIAHDFNNMLAAILAISESAQEDTALESPAQEGLKNIRAVAVRAAEIVRELMAYSGQGKAGFEPVDISQLVAELVHLMKVSIAKNATLNIELADNLPPVLANPAQVRQVVMNLITNGSEAIGGNPGILKIKTTHVRAVAANGSFGEHASSDQIRLEVSDTGIGMTDEVKARIFDPFFTTKFSGRGLGLAAVRGIIQNHGGTIDVVSAPGQGSRFEILLPVTDQAPKSNGVPAEAAVCAKGRTATILMVEDEEALRSSVSKLLRRKGFSILEAGDGKSAVEIFRKNGERVDALLLDMTLPDLPGSQVLEEVRRIRPAVGVVVTTAYSRDSVQGKILEAPAAYLRKPYQIGELLTVLGSVLPASSAHTAS
jgi:PAS domain S-box-containing protein